MARSIFWNAVTIVNLVQSTAASEFVKRANTTDVLQYVNPLIGSQKGGNVFAGASLPYGMAKGKFSSLVAAYQAH